MASMNLGPSKDSNLMTMFRSALLTPTKPRPVGLSLAGQTALITGSNGGIGFAAATNFLDHGLSTLIMGVRNVESGERAAETLRKSYPGASILVWRIDMLSYDSIREFVKRCETELPRTPPSGRVLDIAILNAGVAQLEFKLNPETGHEETFQTNYLSTALLAILLLPLLRSPSKEGGRSSSGEKKQTAPTPGRMTIVASGSGLTAQFTNASDVPLIPSLDTKPADWGHLAAFERYSVSKLLVFMLVHKLSESVPSSSSSSSSQGVIINGVEPGLTKDSGLMRHVPYGLMRLGFWFFKLVASKTPEQASWTYLDAAVVVGAETHGGLMMNWGVRPFANMMYTPEGKASMEQLWMETMQELDFVGAKGILDGMG